MDVGDQLIISINANEDVRTGAMAEFFQTRRENAGSVTSLQFLTLRLLIEILALYRNLVDFCIMLEFRILWPELDLI
jgi:hypothetical protein